MGRNILIISLSLITLGLLYFVGHTYVQDKNKLQASMHQAASLQPQPSFGPQEVVDLQVKAMQRNNYPYENHGIEIAYRFASPENRRNTGPLERFQQMVNNDIYRSLLNAQRYGLDDVEVDGDVAVQKVTLIDVEDQPVVYFFQLSKQQDGPYKDCWMTDSVLRY